MMNGRWSLFVDAGWLFAAGSEMAFGETRARAELDYNPALLTQGLIEAGQALVGDASLLRLGWYDAAPNRQMMPEHMALAEVQSVKVRLGRLSRAGQKGVDTQLAIDVVRHAFQQTLTDVVILTGDEDLLEAMEVAQHYGMGVHLLEIPAGGVSRDLLRAADRRGLLTESFWKQVFLPETGQEPITIADPTDTTTPEEFASGIEERSETPATDLISLDQPPAPPKTPTRIVAPKIGKPSQPPAPDKKPKWMKLPLIDSAEERFPEIETLTERFFQKWLDTTTMTEINLLLGERPYLPQELSADLMRTVASAVEGSNELSRIESAARRDSFWTLLEQFSSGQH